MIFDYELMFTNENTAHAPVTNGVVGRVLDLAGKGQGKGFKIWLALAFTEAVTGSSLKFSVETADNVNFTNGKTIPLSLPPLGTDDMTVGSVYSAPLPAVGMERYCRLKATAASAVTLTGLKSGFVLDAPQE